MFLCVRRPLMEQRRAILLYIPLFQLTVVNGKCYLFGKQKRILIQGPNGNFLLPFVCSFSPYAKCKKTLCLIHYTSNPSYRCVHLWVVLITCA